MALSPERIQELRQQYQITPGAIGGASPERKIDELRAAWGEGSMQEDTVQPSPFDSGLGKVAKDIYNVEKDVATGFAKGGTSTFLGLGELGRGIQKGVGAGIDAVTRAPIIGDILPDTNLEATAQEGIFEKGSPENVRAREIATPEGMAEQVGFGAEQAAEYFAPAGMASRAEKAVQAGTQALPGIVGAGARILGKGVAQGVPAAGVAYLQTGDAEQALQTGLTAGAIRGGMATIGEGARAIKLPQTLMSNLFKNTKNDMLAELNSNALEKFRRTDPALYRDFVQKGIIKTGEGGRPIINDTVAEQALARGLQGSVDDMANEVVIGGLKSEDSARRLASGWKKPIDVGEKQFLSVLDDIAKEYEGVGFGEVSDEANNLASKIELSGGKLSANDALTLRRFFDRLRISSSFDKPASKLSLTQANFKTLADAVRGRVNSIPGMQKVMDDYSFYIDALDDLAKEAARTGNNQVIGLIDSMFLAGTAATGSPIPAVMGLARKALLSNPGGLTGTAQGLYRGTVGPVTGATTGAFSSGAASFQE